MRLLDCKSEECRALLPSPPPVFDHLCAECKDHFTQVRRLLDSVGVGCTLNSRLVRGLDYYTKTTFEYNMAGIGAQDALGGGGRYDGLVEECGGGPTPGVGVACGIERCVLAMKASASDDRYAQKLDVYIVALGERAREKAFSVAFELRGAGISADYDILGRGLKAQMRYADKLRARYVAIIGDDELDAGVATLKNMTGGEQERVGFDSLRDRLFQIMAPGRVC